MHLVDMHTVEYRKQANSGSLPKDVMEALIHKVPRWVLRYV